MDLVLGSRNLETDGSLLPGFPVVLPREVLDSPALADLDGDGLPEIVAVSFEGGLHVVSGDGTRPRLAGGRIRPGHPLGTTVVSTPLVEDLEGDGTWEIVVAGHDGAVWIFETGAASRGAPGWCSQRGARSNTAIR